MVGLLFEVIGWMIRAAIVVMAAILAAIVWVYKELAHAIHSHRAANDPTASEDTSKVMAGGIVAALLGLLLLIGTLVSGGADDGSRPNQLARGDERPAEEDESFALAGAEKRLENAGYRVHHSPGPTVVAGLVVNEGAMQVHLAEFVRTAAGAREIRQLEALAKQRPIQVQVGHPEFGDRYTLLWATIEEPATLPLEKLLRIAKTAIDLDLVDEARIETSQAEAGPEPVQASPDEPTDPAPETPTAPDSPTGSGGGTPSYSSCEAAPANVPVPPGSPLDADGDGIGCES